jgi:ribonuclease VapC
MVIDASALIAILFEEPEAQHFTQAILANSHRRISAVNLLEAAIRADHDPNGSSLGPALDALVLSLDLRVEAVLPEHVALAREAYRKFDRGNHPARLNFGDCVAYAVAKATGEPLLFKGQDFARTDIASV